MFKVTLRNTEGYFGQCIKKFLIKFVPMNPGSRCLPSSIFIFLWLIKLSLKLIIDLKIKTEFFITSYLAIITSREVIAILTH